MNNLDKEIQEALNSLLLLPRGIKETLFDGTLRNLDSTFTYIGKIYEVKDKYRNDKIYERFNIDFVAVIKDGCEVFHIGKSADFPSSDNWDDVCFWLDWDSLSGEFRSDLKLLLGEFDAKNMAMTFTMQKKVN